MDRQFEPIDLPIGPTHPMPGAAAADLIDRMRRALANPWFDRYPDHLHIDGHRPVRGGSDLTPEQWDRVSDTARVANRPETR